MYIYIHTYIRTYVYPSAHEQVLCSIAGLSARAPTGQRTNKNTSKFLRAPPNFKYLSLPPPMPSLYM